jgi:hypothetical protein
MTDDERLKRLEHADFYLEEVQRRQREEERQDSQDLFDYTPWIAALSMPFTKEIEQGLRVNGHDSSFENKFKPISRGTRTAPNTSSRWSRF